MGLSTALHLLLQGRSPSTITVAERDPTLRLNSASLSAGGLRTQFSLPENIKLSQYMLKLLSDDAKPLTQLLATVCEKHGAEPPSQDDVNQSVNFLPGGYLFLACSAAGATSLRDNSGIQPNTEYIASQAAIETKFPYLTTADLTAGECMGEGKVWGDQAKLRNADPCPNYSTRCSTTLLFVRPLSNPRIQPPTPPVTVGSTRTASFPSSAESSSPVT